MTKRPSAATIRKVREYYKRIPKPGPTEQGILEALQWVTGEWDTDRFARWNPPVRRALDEEKE